MRQGNSALKLSLGVQPAETILASKTSLLSHREDYFISASGGKRPLDAYGCIEGKIRAESVNWLRAACWTTELNLLPQKTCRGPTSILLAFGRRMGAQMSQSAAMKWRV